MFRKIAVVLAGVVALALFAGCASPGSAPQMTPAQIFQIACPPVQAAITEFTALDASLPASAQTGVVETDLKLAAPVVAAACTAGATVSVANVTAFAQTVLPVLGTVAGTLPLPPATMAEVQAGLIAAEIAVGVAGTVESNIAAAKAANAAPAAPASAASGA